MAVIQVRDVPDGVRDTLAELAATEGLSLSRYVRRELERIALFGNSAEYNLEVVRQTRERVGGSVSRQAILAALHDGREDRFE